LNHVVLPVDTVNNLWQAPRREGAQVWIT